MALTNQEAAVAQTLQVAEHFAPGSKVAVLPRVTDFPLAGTDNAVKTVTVPQDGEIKLDGLKPFAQYWLTDGDRSVAYTAPGRLTAEPGTREAVAEEIQRRSDAAADMRNEHPNLGPGLHATSDTAPDDHIAAHNYEKSKEPEPTPAAKYVDVKGPQRTGADIGTAYPVDPSEIQPQPAVEDIKDGTPQRTGADEGYATPVDPAEIQPGPRYEDEKGKQRLGADTGTAYPIPKTTSKTEIEKAKSDSVSKAKGATKPVAGTDKTPAKKAKGSPKATTAQAKKVDDPVKPAAKKATRKVDEA